MSVEVCIFKVEVGNIFSNTVSHVAFLDSVSVLANRHFLELHEVLSQSSGLVREHVVDLTKLLVQVTGLDLSAKVFCLIIDFDIPLNELSLSELDYFHSHNQGNWDEVTKSSEI